MSETINSNPITQAEFKALLGKRVPKDLVCYQCYPVVSIDDRIIDFVFPGSQGFPKSWSYMFGEYPNALYFHPEFDELNEVYR